MIANANRPKWHFYLEWIALHVLSVLIAWAIYLALISPIERLSGNRIVIGGQSRIAEDFFLPYIFWPALGLANGILQSLLLRQRVSRMGSWVVATALSWSLGLFGARILYSATALVGPVLSGLAQVLLPGGTIGLAQWLVLRQRVPHAGWWILANTLGWTVGALFSRVLDLWVLVTPALGTVIAWWLLLDWLPRHEAKRLAAG